MPELDGTQALWLWELVKPILTNDATLTGLVPGGWFFMGDPRALPSTSPPVYPAGRFNILSDQTQWALGPTPWGGYVTFNTVITVQRQSVLVARPPLARIYQLLHGTGHTLGNGLRASIFYETTDLPAYDRREAETTYFYSVGARYTAEIEPT